MFLRLSFKIVCMLMNTSTRLLLELSGNGLLLVYCFHQFVPLTKVVGDAAGTNCMCYKKLHDSPTKSTTEENDDISKLPPAQRKSMQKQKKAEACAKHKLYMFRFIINYLNKLSIIRMDTVALQ
jgi:hypothetical protein